MFGVTFTVVVFLEVVVVQSAPEREYSSATDEAQVLMKNHSVESTPLAKGNQEIQFAIHKLGEVEIPLCTALGIALKEEYLILLCIYVVDDIEKNETLQLQVARVFERNYPFNLLTLIVIEEFKRSIDMIYDEILKSLYATDLRSDCTWHFTLHDQQLTRWLVVDSGVYQISLSSDGGILALGKVNGTLNKLEAYGLDGNFVSFLLPDFILDPTKVIQTPDGRFIISHITKMRDGGRQALLTQLTRDGKLIGNFIPLDESQRLSYVVGMTLDPDHDLMFVSDAFKNRMILLDSSSLTWRQEFPLKEIYPRSIYYDVKRSELFVEDWSQKYHIFSISRST